MTFVQSFVKIGQTRRYRKIRYKQSNLRRNPEGVWVAACFSNPCTNDKRQALLTFIVIETKLN
jgi:hypothetical protein